MVLLMQGDNDALMMGSIGNDILNKVQEIQSRHEKLRRRMSQLKLKIKKINCQRQAILQSATLDCDENGQVLFNCAPNGNQTPVMLGNFDGSTVEDVYLDFLQIHDGQQSPTPSHASRSRIPTPSDAMNINSAAITFKCGMESMTASCPSKMGKMAMYGGKSRIPSLGLHGATMEDRSDASSQPSTSFSLCSDIESSQPDLPMNMDHANGDNVGRADLYDMSNFSTITPTKMDELNGSGYTYGSPSPINMDDVPHVPQSNLCDQGSPMWCGSAKKISFSPKDHGSPIQGNKSHSG
mmetsp:Transcript_3790/g.6678  ORF Transcript_3790/g.6678 Transcript_3790/m.6678 type:complete len:295 (-) Transcript_3790:382-1266(-)